MFPPHGTRHTQGQKEDPVRAREENGVEHKIADQDASWLDWLEVGALDASAEL